MLPIVIAWYPSPTEIIGARKYTLSHYLSFDEQMKTKAAWLEEELGNEDGGDEKKGSWTAQRVQLCLYAAAHDQKQPAEPKKKAAPVSKRKAASASTREQESEADGKQAEQKEEETPRSLRMRRRAN